MLRALALSVVAACALLGAARAEDVRAKLDTGAVVGAADTQVASFKGIPYAAPPVGDLRWRAPQPPASWTGERKALDYGAICPQQERPRYTVPSTPAPSEDCLTLNVWAPAHAKGAPVALWIHGGGNTAGSSSNTFYDGTAFAKDGVILVSINYRLGVLGFFAHPAIQGGDTGEANFALLDQVAALRWVQRNIAAFGGDPAKVTVMGESAGGQDVMALLAMPAAKGMFAQGIVESPGGGLERYPTLAVAQANTVDALKGLKATTAADLRKLPVQALLDAAPEAGLVLDSALPQSPLRALATGQTPAIPILIGSNSGEGSLLPPRVTLENGQVRFTPAEIDALKAAYATTDERRLAQYAFRDALFAAPVRWIAAHSKAPAYLYRFDYVAEVMRGRGPDAGHASEIPFVFKTAEPFARGDDDRKVIEVMHGCWVSFIKTGAPSCPAAPTWPAYATADDKLMQVTAAPAYVANPVAKPIALFEAKLAASR